MPIDFYNFAKVKKLRSALGMTQQQLADALGRDRVTIARFETGAQGSLDLLIEYTKYFNKDYRKYLLPVGKAEAETAGKNFSSVL